MRKQTKLVAVLSAAALLALGASMTSFAAGWEKDDAGVWHFYDEDDDMVTGEWKKDGGKWFYLDDDGDMLTDSWVDDQYYVGSDGAMLTNSWIKTYADDEIDDPDDDGESWYYFDSKGKRVEGKSKKIKGKTYYFESDGEMQDGWYSPDSDDVVYLGEEDDGARASGWLWLDSPDLAVVGHDDDGNCQSEICDDEGWYWFSTSNGQMYKEAGRKKINGKYYYFNEHGQMLYEWVNAADLSGASTNEADGEATASVLEAANMIYANAVEEGWRADGWYEIDGAKDTGKQDDTDWYYFKDGKAKKAAIAVNGVDQLITCEADGTPVYRARIKVSGKWFCFNEYGQMQTGLQAIGSGNDVKFYYFDEDGYQKTGKVANVEEDNDSFLYNFNTKNGGNGKGVTGVKDGYLYWNGKRLEADDDFRLYSVNGLTYLVNNKGKVQTSTSKEYDVENWNGTEATLEDVKFAFVSKNQVVGCYVEIADDEYSNYKQPIPADTVTAPQIELYDQTFVYTDANQDGEWQ